MIALLAHQIRFEQLIFWRNRGAAFFTFVLPVALLVFFLGIGQDFETADGTPYRQFLVPGVIALAIASTTFQALSIALAYHREQGVLKLLRATPLPARVLLTGKLVSTIVVAAIVVALAMLIAVGLFAIEPPQRPLVFVLVCAVGAVTFSSLGFAVAGLIRSAESAPAVVNAVYLPMLFLCGVFFDIDAAPGWLAAIGKALPLYHLVEPTRSAWLESSDPVWPSLLVLVGWAVVSVAVALVRFSWQPAHERA